jgi:16S rRNA (cytidine1402-2'-O)-methyltransferase
LRELARALADGEILERGEFVVVVGAGKVTPAVADPDRAREEVQRLVGQGVAPSEAARQVAAATGLSRRELYRARIREPNAH